MQRTTTPPDNQNNYFEILNNGKTITLNLVLGKDNKSRRIGVVLLENRTLFINKKRDKHLFIKNNSYGFNEHILRTGRTFDKVQISDEHITAVIPVKTILLVGSYLHFLQAGYERQIFVTLEQLKQYEIKPNF